MNYIRPLITTHTYVGSMCHSKSLRISLGQDIPSIHPKGSPQVNPMRLPSGGRHLTTIPTHAVVFCRVVFCGNLSVNSATNHLGKVYLLQEDIQRGSWVPDIDGSSLTSCFSALWPILYLISLGVRVHMSSTPGGACFVTNTQP